MMTCRLVVVYLQMSCAQKRFVVGLNAYDHRANGLKDHFCEPTERSTARWFVPVHTGFAAKRPTSLGFGCAARICEYARDLLKEC